MSRYLGDSSFRSEVVDLAESLFERAVGRRVIEDRYVDEAKVIRNSCRLSNVPVNRIESIQAKCERYDLAPLMGETDWIDVSLDDVLWSLEGRLLLPSSVYGSPYTSARIVYYAGLAYVTGDIIRCVDEIASLIDAGLIDEWSGLQAISEDAAQTITRWKAR